MLKTFRALLIECDSIEWPGTIVPEVTWEATGTGARTAVTYSRVKA
jgi:hypothetical protein